MSVLERPRITSQQLLTVPIIRSIDAFTAADFQALYANLLTGITSPYIVAGLTINITGSSFSTAASNLTIATANSLILATTSQQVGSLLPISGTSADSLNSALNSKIVGSFSANATNYISIDLIREADTTSSDTVYLWNDTQQQTIKRQQYTSTVLDYRIYISTNTPASTQILIAEVVTDSLGIPTAINDCRPLFFRLGSGGITPNPFFNYSWPQGQNENPFSSSSSATNPFVGGDKAIGTFKDWANAVMSSIKQMKGTAYWYQNAGSSGGGGSSLLTVDEDANLSYATSPGPPPGVMHYNAAVTGDMYWDQPVYIRSVISSQYYKIDSTTLGSLVLSDGDVSFISLNRYITLSGNLSFSPSLSGIPASVITAAGNNGAQIVSGTAPVFTGMTSGVGAGGTGSGDFIKAITDTNESFNQVVSFFDNTGVTSAAASAYYAILNASYTGTTGSLIGEYSQTFYTGSSITKSSRAAALSIVPLGSMYWIGFRDNTNIYTHWLGSLRPGEDRQIDNETSNDLLTYIGSPNESTTIPNYSATPTTGNISFSSGQVNYSSSSSDDLTTRLGRVTSMLANEAQNKNIIVAGGGTVLNSGSLVTWNATVTISIGGPTGTIMNWIPAGSADLSSSNYRCAYVSINRNSSVSLNVSITTFDLLPLQENIFTIAYKFDTTSVYLGVGGQSYVISSGGSSISGFNPAPATALGVANIQKAFSEIPAGSINSLNKSFTLAQTPFSSTSLLLFKNGVFQYQDASSGDYSVANNQITMTLAPNTNDELVATYWLGNNLVYSYIQEHHVSVAVTNTFALTNPLTLTNGAAVWLNGLLRYPGTNSDYTASPSAIMFNYNITSNSKVDVFFTSNGDNLFSYNYTVKEASNASRSTYSFFGDVESQNSFILAIDGVTQWPIKNTINNTSITVVDYIFTTPNTLNINNTVLTNTSVISLWIR